MLGKLDRTERALETEPGFETERNVEIHANIDDMSAEAFQPLMDRLLDAGARDVYLTPIIMKKARPATKVSVLCAPNDANRLENILFSDSTTIGVRIHDVEKLMLPRTEVVVTTAHGEVRVKIVDLPDGERRWKLEHDDVVRLANEQGIDYLKMNRILTGEVMAQLAPPPENTKP
jgi:uncharacterized protein (DUF111 family)